MDVPDVSYARSGDVAIAYQVVGDGPIDLVFIRGYARRPARGLGHAALRRPRRDACRVGPGLLFDKRGSGLSDPVRAGSHAGDENGRRPRGHGCRRLRARGALGGPGGRPDRAPVRSHVPGAHECSRPLRPDRPGLRAPDYPWARTEDGGRAATNPRALGRPRVPRGACAPPEPVRRPERASGSTGSSWYNGAARARPRRSRFTAWRWRATCAKCCRRSGADVRAAPPEDARRGGLRRRADPRSQRIEVDGLHDCSAGPTRAQRRPPSRDAPVHRRLRDAPRARSRAGDGPLHGHRRLDRARGGPRRRGWSELLARHHTLVRGELVGSAGGARHGRRRLLRRVRRPRPRDRVRVGDPRRGPALGLELRAGLHTGECERVDGKLGGIAVPTGARIASLAEPGEVLVSSTVKDLVAGSGIEFEDRGTRELKGVPGEWRLFAVR